MRFLNNSASRHFVSALSLVLLIGCSQSSDSLDWPSSFGYSSSEIADIKIDDFGFPNIPVTIGDHEVLLPFDTGNMVGVSLNTTLFDRLGMESVQNWSRVDSAGEFVATLRVGESRPVVVLGMDVGQKQIFEFDHPTLPGLYGPADLDVDRFTLDYGARRIATSSSTLASEIPGYTAIQLIRSDLFPSLILVHGMIEGRQVVMELDTGKSRSVVNPTLAADLNLKRVNHGVHIANLQIGDLSFSVRSAKEVDQTAIDPGLQEHILVGVGSDILSQFVWTVDYSTSILWLPVVR